MYVSEQKYQIPTVKVFFKIKERKTKQSDRKLNISPDFFMFIHRNATRTS